MSRRHYVSALVGATLLLFDWLSHYALRSTESATINFFFISNLVHRGRNLINFLFFRDFLCGSHKICPRELFVITIVKLAQKRVENFYFPPF
jgi:hypothetical protein